MEGIPWKISVGAIVTENMDSLRIYRKTVNWLTQFYFQKMVIKML